MNLKDLKQLDTCKWEIPRTGSMKVPGIIYAHRSLISEMDDKVREQLSNVAALPGIVRAAMAMPDAHWGYGFPIGGVAAFDPDDGGIISVGGVGYDISCGVRTMLTGLHRSDIIPVLDRLIGALFEAVPAGVGSEGSIRLSPDRLDDVLVEGAKWAIDHGYGEKEDLDFIEDGGVLQGADPSCVSDKAKQRQYRQVGTLGAGNHYLEIQYVEKVFEPSIAEVFGLEEQGVVVSIHCGSRALGHQIASDYIQILARASDKYGIPIRERELVCAPILSEEGKRYFRAMLCGINCALANRQVITHLVRQVFARILPQARLRLMYDVSHNTCKVENHKLKGKTRRLYVHRKGATRAFGPGRTELPPAYRQTGQPVIIGGTMGTCSYVLAGLESGMELAWGSACHGAGRAMSRRAALKKWKGKKIIKGLMSKGIQVRAASMQGAAEESPEAYKDVNAVVDSTDQAELARKVALLRPLACIKG